ncbi:response regulator transcription factor, partial [Candidatus Saccharibacteria bacterium]|nr:response regulator transcription factor [Candidatus Saccharibacteria bacterium]
MRVLIVEDEPKIAKSLKRGLESETFSVDVVGDGDNALSYGRSSEYDVIIMDWMIPGSMDGPAVCDKLRAEGVTTPILMLTAKAEVDNKVKGLSSGADDYLAKPFAFDELVARLYALLRRPRNFLGNAMVYDKLSVNSDSKQVFYDGELVDLTAKEFALLEYLLRRKGQVVSKLQLIEHVWSDDDDTLENTVEVYIGYLRSKIDKKYGIDIIQTK